jgi:hypothetical protein
MTSPHKALPAALAEPAETRMFSAGAAGAAVNERDRA